jgi:hypothetical protein
MARPPVASASLDDVRDAILTMYNTTDNAARHAADDWLREVNLHFIFGGSDALRNFFIVLVFAVPSNPERLADGRHVPDGRCVRFARID